MVRHDRWGPDLIRRPLVAISEGFADYGDHYGFGTGARCSQPAPCLSSSRTTNGRRTGSS
jgi:hypothetical protein